MSIDLFELQFTVSSLREREKSNRILERGSAPEAKKKKKEQGSSKPLLLRREKADTLRYSDNLHYGCNGAEHVCRKRRSEAQGGIGDVSVDGVGGGDGERCRIGICAWVGRGVPDYARI